MDLSCFTSVVGGKQTAEEAQTHPDRTTGDVIQRKVCIDPIGKYGAGIIEPPDTDLV